MAKNFGKNLAKSFLINVPMTLLEEGSPSLKAAIEQDIEDIPAIKEEISNSIKKGKNYSGKVLGGVSTIFSKQTLKNAKEDLLSGNIFGNRERGQKAIEKATMGDFGDEDFGSSFDEMNSAFDELGGSSPSSNSTSSSSYSENGNEFNSEFNVTRNMYDNKKLTVNNNVSGSLMKSVAATFASGSAATINSIERINSFNAEDTKAFYEKTYEFYNTTTEYLKQMADTMKSIYHQEVTNNTRNIMSDIFGNNGMLDVKKYISMVNPIKRLDEIFDDENWGMYKGFFDSFQADPIGTIMSTIVGNATPDYVKKEFSDLETNINKLTKNLVIELAEGRAGNGGIFKQVMGQLFGLDLSEVSKNINAKANPANYKKDAIAFDGVTKKAIVEVIPFYLKYIMAYTKAIAGNTSRTGGNVINDSDLLTMDYDKGIMVTDARIKNRKKDEELNIARSDYNEVFKRLDEREYRKFYVDENGKPLDMSKEENRKKYGDLRRNYENKLIRSSVTPGTELDFLDKEQEYLDQIEKIKKELEGVSVADKLKEENLTKRKELSNLEKRLKDVQGIKSENLNAATSKRDTLRTLVFDEIIRRNPEDVFSPEALNNGISILDLINSNSKLTEFITKNPNMLADANDMLLFLANDKRSRADLQQSALSRLINQSNRAKQANGVVPTGDMSLITDETGETYMSSAEKRLTEEAKRKINVKNFVESALENSEDYANAVTEEEKLAAIKKIFFQNMKHTKDNSVIDEEALYKAEREKRKEEREKLWNKEFDSYLPKEGNRSILDYIIAPFKYIADRVKYMFGLIADKVQSVLHAVNRSLSNIIFGNEKGLEGNFFDKAKEFWYSEANPLYDLISDESRKDYQKQQVDLMAVNNEITEQIAESTGVTSEAISSIQKTFTTEGSGYVHDVHVQSILMRIYDSLTRGKDPLSLKDVNENYNKTAVAPMSEDNPFNPKNIAREYALKNNEIDEIEDGSNKKLSFKGSIKRRKDSLARQLKYFITGGDAKELGVDPDKDGLGKIIYKRIDYSVLSPAKDFLLGKKDSTGKRPASKWLDQHGKELRNVGLGGLGGAVGGSLIFAMNPLLGASLGMLMSTNKFKEEFFGDKPSSVKNILKIAMIGAGDNRLDKSITLNDNFFTILIKRVDKSIIKPIRDSINRFLFGKKNKEGRYNNFSDMGLLGYLSYRFGHFLVENKVTEKLVHILESGRDIVGSYLKFFAVKALNIITTESKAAIQLFGGLINTGIRKITGFDMSKTKGRAKQRAKDALGFIGRKISGAIDYADKKAYQADAHLRERKYTKDGVYDWQSAKNDDNRLNISLLKQLTDENGKINTEQLAAMGASGILEDKDIMKQYKFERQYQETNRQYQLEKWDKTTDRTIKLEDLKLAEERMKHPDRFNDNGEYTEDYKAQLANKQRESVSPSDQWLGDTITSSLSDSTESIVSTMKSVALTLVESITGKRLDPKAFENPSLIEKASDSLSEGEREDELLLNYDKNILNNTKIEETNKIEEKQSVNTIDNKTKPTATSGNKTASDLIEEHKKDIKEEEKISIFKDMGSGINKVATYTSKIPIFGGFISKVLMFLPIIGGLIGKAFGFGKDVFTLIRGIRAGKDLSVISEGMAGGVLKRTLGRLTTALPKIKTFSSKGSATITDIIGNARGNTNILKLKYAKDLKNMFANSKVGQYLASRDLSILYGKDSILRAPFQMLKATPKALAQTYGNVTGGMLKAAAKPVTGLLKGYGSVAKGAANLASKVTPHLASKALPILGSLYSIYSDAKNEDGSIDIAKGLVGKTGDTVKDLFINAGKTALKGAGIGIAFGGPIGALIGGAVGGLFGLFGTDPEKAAGLLTPMLESAGEAFSGFMDKTADAITDFIPSLIEKVVGLIVEPLDMFAEWLDSDSGEIKGDYALMKFGSAILNVGKKAGGLLLKVMCSIFKTAGKVIWKFPFMVARALLRPFAKVGKKIGSWIAKKLGFLDIFETAIGKIEGFFSSVFEFIDSPIEFLKKRLITGEGKDKEGGFRQLKGDTTLESERFKSLKGYANGGLITEPSLVVAGEKEPEVIASQETIRDSARQALFDFFSNEVAPKAKDTVKMTGKNYMDGYINLAKGVHDGAMDHIHGEGNTPQVGEEKNGLIYTGSRWLTRNALKLGQAVGNMIWDGSKLVAKESWDKAKEGAEKAKELASWMQQGIFGTTFEKTKDIVKWLKDNGPALFGKLLDLLGGLFGKAKEKAGQMWDGAKQAIGGAASSIMGGVNRVRGGFISLDQLKGGSVPDRIYSFLRTKGMSHNQAVAIMGNIQQESNFNTKAISFDGEGSIGLMQWTGDRRKALQQFASKMGKKEDDLDAQLNFMWHELVDDSSGYEAQQFKKFTSLGKDADITTLSNAFSKHVERPNAAYAHNEKRAAYANAFGQRYAGQTGDNLVGSTGIFGSFGNTQNGKKVGPFTFYQQHDPQWANIPYGSSGTLRSSACGPTSLAMLLSAYGYNFTPPQVAQWSAEHGYRVAGSGTNANLFPAFASEIGFHMNNSQDPEDARMALSQGKPVIVNHGRGDFTGGGHYMLYAGMNGNKVHLLDPGPREKSGDYDFDYLIRDALADGTGPSTYSFPDMPPTGSTSMMSNALPSIPSTLEQSSDFNGGGGGSFGSSAMNTSYIGDSGNSGIFGTERMNALKNPIPSINNANTMSTDIRKQSISANLSNDPITSSLATIIDILSSINNNTGEFVKNSTPNKQTTNKNETNMTFEDVVLKLNESLDKLTSALDGKSFNANTTNNTNTMNVSNNNTNNNNNTDVTQNKNLFNASAPTLAEKDAFSSISTAFKPSTFRIATGS